MNTKSTATITVRKLRRDKSIHLSLTAEIVSLVIRSDPIRSVSILTLESLPLLLLFLSPQSRWQPKVQSSRNEVRLGTLQTNLVGESTNSRIPLLSSFSLIYLYDPFLHFVRIATIVD